MKLSEDQIAELLRTLPAAPEHVVAAAKDLPSLLGDDVDDGGEDSGEADADQPADTGIDQQDDFQTDDLGGGFDADDDTDRHDGHDHSPDFGDLS